MENGRFRQEPDFRSGAARIQPVGEIRIASNGRVIMPGETFRRSEPIPGTSNRRVRNSGQRNR